MFYVKVTRTRRGDFCLESGSRVLTIDITTASKAGLKLPGVVHYAWGASPVWVWR
jgi:hypothetical protein